MAATPTELEEEEVAAGGVPPDRLGTTAVAQQPGTAGTGTGSYLSPYAATPVPPASVGANRSMPTYYAGPTDAPPPHRPPAAGLPAMSLHGGAYDFLSSDADDEAAVLAVMDQLLAGDATFDPAANPQQASLIASILAATPDQLITAGYGYLIDRLVEEGYLRSAGGVVDPDDVAASYDQWTPEQQAQWDQLENDLTLPPGMMGVDPEEELAKRRVALMESWFQDLTWVNAAGEEVATNTSSLAQVLNESFWSEQQPGLVDMGATIARAGGTLLTYDQWRASAKVPPGVDNMALRQGYQDALLRQTFIANQKVELGHEDELIYFEWNPLKPDQQVTVKRGEEIDTLIYQALTEQVQARAAVGEALEPGAEPPPLTLTPAGFAQSTFDDTAYGQQVINDIVAKAAQHGFVIDPRTISFQATGGFGGLPTLADNQAATFGGIDPNMLPEGTVLDIAESLAQQFPGGAAGEDLTKLLNETRNNPDLLPTLTAVVTSISDENVNPRLFQFVSGQVDQHLASAPVVQAQWRVTPRYGTLYGQYDRRPFEIPMIPDSGWQNQPGYESPGFMLNLDEGDLSGQFGVRDRMGDPGTTWGDDDLLQHLVQVSEAAGIPWAITAQALATVTNNFQTQMPLANAKVTVGLVVGDLTRTMGKRNNPALAMVEYFVGEGVADVLQNVGYLDPQKAAQVLNVLSTEYQYMQALDPSFKDVTIEMALQALTANANQTGRGAFQFNLTDPEAVKERLRGVYDSLLMPIDDATLNRFAAQFRAMEIEAQQPGLNAYNAQTDAITDMWTSTREVFSNYTGEWMFPVQAQGVRFSDDFEAARDKRHTHGGIDIMAPMGAPIVAPVDGVITDAGTDGGAGGTRIWLTGKDGVRYYFAHLYSLMGSFAGKTVGQGDLIGLVGNSGNAYKGGTGAPHLHFEMHTNGQKNPQSLDPSSSGRMNPYGILTESYGTGVTAITPWKQELGWDIGNYTEEQATDALAGDVITVTLPDLEARAMKMARSTPLYKELFGNKPGGVGAVEYATAYGSRAEQAVGIPSPEAARVGLATNSLEAMWGRLVSDLEAQETSPTLRDRMFGIGNAFSAAMVGRR